MFQLFICKFPFSKTKNRACLGKGVMLHIWSFSSPVQGRAVLRFLLLFFVFPYMWFLLQQHEMKVTEDEDGSHVGWPWWSWRELMVVGVKGVGDREVLWRARPKVEMPWATVHCSRGERSGGRVQNIGRVISASTLTAPSPMLGTTSPILRFSNPNFKASISSAMKIKEEEEVVFPF